ncbi:aldo/keto reductase family protein [Rhizoctonia solani]|uniref:Aldo/keto reductase family protein n=1 Tax=Rhizoctonia solani TaxID=456999 RepID=A0A8H8NYR9_9AGAM|nr:aldo/keto reductase family protein [Rhizoctonia solani]QRW21135.1 aldo/keto reductase family protein [Rhizoctonia solani]
MSSINPPKKIPYVRLGNSGLKVLRLILGLASYGNKSMEEWVLGKEEGIAHIKAVYGAGIQTFDTANVYSHGDSEQILGKAIKQLGLPRDEIVVMTKVYNVVMREPGLLAPGPEASASGYVNQYGLSRKHIFESIRNSLERLELDYVDVLQCHRFDYNIPIAETMQALHDVVKAGYARYIGMSSCHAYQFHAMQNYEINNGLTPFVSMQNLYNLIYREEEREMMPTLKMFGTGMIPWSPLSQGILSRPYSQTSHRTETGAFVPMTNRSKEDNKEVILCIEKIAKDRGISMAQVAIAWGLSKSNITAPIIGVTSLERLKDTIGAISVKLTDEEIKHLEEPYIAQPIQGYS